MSSGRGPPDGAAGAAPVRRGGCGGLDAARPPRRAPASSSVVVVGLRIGVGGEQHRRVALGVEHFRCVVRVLGQLERVGRQARDGRRGLHADLDEPLDTETARGLLDEQQVLRLDPAHRAGELPGQQLDDDLAAQLGGFSFRQVS